MRSKTKNQKRKMLSLITKLRLPLSINEANEYLEKLSGQEIDLLVEKFQIINDYEDLLENISRVINPAKFKQIEEEHDKRVTQLKDDYLSKMEQFQEELDNKLDGIDLKANKDFENISEKLNVEFNDLDTKHRLFYSRTRSFLSRN